MFERFTKDARLVVTLAVEEAQNRSDARIGNEHLLLGVAGSGGALADLDLAELRFELDRLDERALEAVGIDPGILDVGTSRSRERSGKRHMPFTRAAKDTLTNALKEAIALDHRYIGVEHIALALTTLPDSDRATLAMAGRGVVPAHIRRTLLETLRKAS
jgi:ATP-dependent Clp protease ATP-binding subunit ClpA